MQEWVQYNRLEPFGSQRDDLRAVFPAWVFYSLQQPPKKEGGKPLTLPEFMEEYWPDWLSTEEEKEQRRQRKIQSKLKRLFGGR